MEDWVIILLSFIFLFTVFYIVFSIPPTEVPKNEIRIRCPPKKILENIVQTSDITNTGYVNEIMYKPEVSTSFQFQNNLLEGVPSIPLNGGACDKMSKNLPIGDINVEYLIKNNSSFI